MVNRYFDDFITNTHGARISQHTMPMDADVKSEVIPFKFSGSDKVVVSEGTLYTSESIGIGKFKNVYILANNNVNADNLLIDFNVSNGSNIRNVSYYDWNKEEWDWSLLRESGIHAGNGAIKLPKNSSSWALLNTHPNLYWLSNLKAINIRMRVIADGDVTSGTNEFSASLVGEKNV